MDRNLDTYERAIALNGAEVLACKYFGSYQGDWWCLVLYEGKMGWVTGAFGSCSGCDAYLNEFAYEEPSVEQLKEFGKSYLDVILTLEQAIKEASQNIDWDGEAQEMVQFLIDEWKKAHPE
jgi:hypothetical protein